jgi:methyl-accepting chemotaxis protein
VDHETPKDDPKPSAPTGDGCGAVTGSPAGPADVAVLRIDTIGIDRLSQAFESSAKRWELIVYPSLFAFILLAAYGFYLVFSLAQDIRFLASSVDSNMTVLAANMRSISDNLGQMNATVRSMSISVDAMTQDMKTLEPMLTSMNNMDRSMREMVLNTAVIRNDMSVMNRNIGRPMNFMNSFMPW